MERLSRQVRFNGDTLARHAVRARNDSGVMALVATMASCKRKETLERKTRIIALADQFRVGSFRNDGRGRIRAGIALRSVS